MRLGGGARGAPVPLGGCGPRYRVSFVEAGPDLKPTGPDALSQQLYWSARVAATSRKGAPPLRRARGERGPFSQAGGGLVWMRVLPLIPV